MPFTKCIGAIPTVITGRPDPSHISMSFVERRNWTARTMMRPYTRLSNGFSRKVENHMAAVALNYFAYNFESPPDPDATKTSRDLQLKLQCSCGVQTWLRRFSLTRLSRAVGSTTSCFRSDSAETLATEV